MKYIIQMSCIFVICGFAIIACKTTLPPVALLPETNIASVEGYQSDSALVESSNIVVMAGTSANISEDLQNILVRKVEQLIIESGSEVVDRERALKFKEEINLKENMGNTFETYQGPVEARFAVIPTIKESNISTAYTKASSYTDDKGKTIRRDPYCTYTANVAANVQIRSLPAMQRVLATNLMATNDEARQNPRSSACNDQDMIDNTTANAINELLAKGSNEYVNLNRYLGSQGLITGAKSDKGKIYFETNLGRLHGAKEEAPVAIYMEQDGEMILIAKGEMLDNKNVLNKKSFIEVDKELVHLIKKGMIVMLSGDCDGLLCDFNQAIKNLTDF